MHGWEKIIFPAEELFINGAWLLEPHDGWKLIFKFNTWSSLKEHSHKTLEHCQLFHNNPLGSISASTRMALPFLAEC